MRARLGTFASFSVYNYRLFFAGSLVSNIGGWMARVAIDWLVLTELTDNSASALGWTIALQFLPIPFLTPFAGALSDRLDKRKMLMLTQIALGLTSLVLWALVATGAVQLWQVYGLALLQGVATAFDLPARQAFVSEMVPTSHIPNAVGLNSAQFNSARLVGPALAGLLIGAFGTASALLINTITFGATIAAVAMMRTSELIPAPKSSRSRGGVRAGVAYVRGKPEIVLMLVIVFVMSTFGGNFPITNALMTTEVFGRGATDYGILGSVMAIGTLGAALLAARRARPRLRWLLLGLGAFAVCQVVSGMATSFTVFALLLIPTGLAQITVLISCNATVQLAAAPEYRGRVMAVYMAVMMSGAPIGSPIVGWIGDQFGARATLYVSGVVLGISAVLITAFLVSNDGIRVRLRRGWPPTLAVVHVPTPATDRKRPALIRRITAPARARLRGAWTRGRGPLPHR